MKKKIKKSKRSIDEIFEYLNENIEKCDNYLKEHPNDAYHLKFRSNLQQLFTVLNIPVVGAQAKKILSEAIDKEGWHSKKIEEPAD